MLSVFDSAAKVTIFFEKQLFYSWKNDMRQPADSHLSGISQATFPVPAYLPDVPRIALLPAKNTAPVLQVSLSRKNF